MSNNPSGYEKKDVNIKAIVLTGVFTVVFIVVALVLLNEYFIAEKESLIEEVVLKPESVQLSDLRAVEEETLTTYKLIDSTKNIYRIPIEQAMEIISRQSSLK